MKPALLCAAAPTSRKLWEQGQKYFFVVQLIENNCEVKYQADRICF